MRSRPRPGAARGAGTGAGGGGASAERGCRSAPGSACARPSLRRGRGAAPRSSPGFGTRFEPPRGSERPGRRARRLPAPAQGPADPRCFLHRSPAVPKRRGVRRPCLCCRAAAAAPRRGAAAPGARPSPSSFENPRAGWGEVFSRTNSRSSAAPGDRALQQRGKR